MAAVDSRALHGKNACTGASYPMLWFASNAVGIQSSNKIDINTLHSSIYFVRSALHRSPRQHTSLLTGSTTGICVI